ncbi:MAG: hypothetical protein AB7E55_08055 [Pigmentiphaga sp.]
MGLAAVHLFAGKLEFLTGKPRNVWLSASGGLSVAFVLLYLIPELAATQQEIEQSGAATMLGFLEHHVYLLALAGITAFYGLERLAKSQSQPQRSAKAGDRSKERVFWAHLASFAVYNLAIGYLLVNEAHSLLNLALFFVVIALHFVVIDFSLRDHYPSVYHDKGRWLLSVAVVAGWAIGVFVEIPGFVMSVAIAFVAGGIILNALKEELPEEKRSRFWPFLLGAVLYATVVVAQARLGQS